MYVGLETSCVSWAHPCVKGVRLQQNTSDTALLHRVWDTKAINVLLMCFSAYQQLKSI